MRPAKNEETNRRLNKHVWPECEFTAAEWLRDKPNTPFQALPLLEGVPGVKGPICQSRAITRHCARIAGIDGETGKGSQLYTSIGWTTYDCNNLNNRDQI